LRSFKDNRGLNSLSVFRLPAGQDESALYTRFWFACVRDGNLRRDFWNYVWPKTVNLDCSLQR